MERIEDTEVYYIFIFKSGDGGREGKKEGVNGRKMREGGRDRRRKGGGLIYV